MRALAMRFQVWTCLVFVAIACGKNGDAAGSAGSAGQLSDDASAGAASAGAASAGAASAGAASAGAASAGAASAGAGNTGAGAGNTSASDPNAGSAGASPGLLECDPNQVSCKRAAPQCVFGEVPRVVDGCYGECVKVDRCACSTAAQCPQPEQYTCWSKSHCGPFVH